MSPLKVAVVSCDPMIRLQAARAFDAAPASWRVRLFESPPDNADIIVFGPDATTGAGILFDPEKPERVLREVATAAGNARVFVVTSAQRGVGVTTVALQLAVASARTHLACFVDCDERWGIASRLGLGETRTLQASDQADEALELAAVPVPGGFRVLIASRAEEMLENLLTRAARVFDPLILDVPGDADVDSALRRATAAVLVISPTRTSAMRTRELIEAHQEARWAIVANRLGPGGEMTRTELERILGRNIALELPCAPRLRDVEDDCSLLTTRLTRWVRRIDELYSALMSA